MESFKEEIKGYKYDKLRKLSEKIREEIDEISTQVNKEEIGYETSNRLFNMYFEISEAIQSIKNLNI